MRRIPCPPSAWAPQPLTLADWHWNAGPDGLLPVGADSLALEMALVRHPATPWPGQGFGVGLRLQGAQGPGGVVLQPLSSEVDTTDTLRVRLGLAAGRLPLGIYSLELGLGELGDGGRHLQIRTRRRLRSLVLDFADDEVWRQHLDWVEHLLPEGRRESLLEAAPAERRALFDALWGDSRRRRDHLLRILEADERFADTRRGAATDRGRAYVRLGPPDRLERKGSPGDRFRRWEIWFYEPDGPVLTFLDSHGLGEYRLIRRDDRPD